MNEPGRRWRTASLGLLAGIALLAVSGSLRGSALDSPAADPFAAVSGTFDGPPAAGVAMDPAQANTVFGEDDRTRVADTVASPYRAIVYLRLSREGTAIRTCSGAMLASNLVLTAAHCITGAQPFEFADAAEVRPGASGGLHPFGSAMATSFSYPAGWIENRPEFDFALLHLDGRPFEGALAPYFTLATMPDGYFAEPGRTLTIAGYPADKPAGTMWQATVPDAAATSVRITTRSDTFPGQSGGPMFEAINGAYLLTGIISIQGLETNSAIRITPEHVAAMRAFCAGRCEFAAVEAVPPPWQPVTKLSLMGLAADR